MKKSRFREAKDPEMLSNRLSELSKEDNSLIRLEVAKNRNTLPEILAILASDPDEKVAEAARQAIRNRVSLASEFKIIS